MNTHSVVADVGGTNIRLATVDKQTGELGQIKKYLCADFATIADVVKLYFAELDGLVKELCIAIACPVDDDLIEMTNHTWSFSQSVLKAALSLDKLYVINDYTAISLAVPFLADDEKVQIGGGTVKDKKAIGICGPGTGLGVGHLININDKWISLDGEGGHTSFAPVAEDARQVLAVLAEEMGHVSAERLLSGQGLENIYRALCKLEGQDPALATAADVSRAGLANDCPIAARTLVVFCQGLGTFAGNLALNLACEGGVYIAGGIVPRFIDYFKTSEFRACFEYKGRFSEYNAGIATFVVLHPDPGLFGAGVYLRQELKLI
ncbi:glucokinase [Motilimonas eburnea]|uniref:glucokinase n=1 Tax=Motilimonas eburnea TaxID=1737488 RepID=UPI001E3DB77B|nr:glucokinase [Motilimonas eburnea]MCE2572011.1 glucokinase [Motilimonas eburnea]